MTILQQRHIPYLILALIATGLLVLWSVGGSTLNVRKAGRIELPGRSGTSGSYCNIGDEIQTRRTWFEPFYRQRYPFVNRVDDLYYFELLESARSAAYLKDAYLNSLEANKKSEPIEVRRFFDSHSFKEAQAESARILERFAQVGGFLEGGVRLRVVESIEITDWAGRTMSTVLAVIQIGSEDKMYIRPGFLESVSN